MSKLKFLSFALGLILLLAILYFSNIEKVILILINSNLFFITFAIISGFILIILKAFRWKTFLSFINVYVSFYLAVSSFNAAFFLSNLTPGRLLEPIRGYLLKLKIKCSFSETTSLVIVERIIDVLIYILFSLILLQIVKMELSENVSTFSIISLLVAFFLSVIGLFILNSKKLTLKFFKIISKFPIINKFKSKAELFAKNFSAGFRKIKTLKSLTVILILTIVIWVFEGLILYFALLSIGIQLPILVCTGMVCLSILMGILSFLPGGLGSTEIILVAFLSSLNISISQATAVTIAYRFISYVIQNLVGMGFLTQAYGLEVLKKYI